MGIKAIIRLVKAFILSLVAVATFINGPSIYAQMGYWFTANTPSEPATIVSANTTILKPVRLPVADIVEEQPLPNQATLTIEKIHVSVPIVFGVSTDAKKIYDSLSNGVVHYSATPKPGQGGGSIILCHSSLYPWQYNKYGAPCALIDKLAPGDKFVVKYSDGRTFTYHMTESLVFDPLTGGDDARIAEFEQSAKPALFLVTCYPINSTSHRKTVKAVLE